MADGEKNVTSFTWTAGNIKPLVEGKEDYLKSPEFETEITLAKSKTLEEKYILKWTLLVKKVIEMDETEQSEHPPKKRRTTCLLAKLPAETVKGHYLGLYLQNINDELPSLPILKVTFSLVKPTTGKIYSKYKELLMIVRGLDFGISDFITITELDKLSLYDLIIFCEFEEVKKDIDSFKPLLFKKMFCDMELHIGDHSYPAHKLVLALSSSFFREKIANDDSLTSLEILHTEPKVFERLLGFMYTGKLKSNKSEGVIDFKLIEAICQFGVWDFFADYKIKETLKTGFNIENVIPMLLILYRVRRMEEIRSFFADCMCFTMVNLARILNLDVFKNLVKMKPELLGTILEKLHFCLVLSKCKKKIDPAVLTESNIGRCTCKHFETLLNNKKYSDIDFHIGDEKYYGHQSILGTRSPVFDRMFSHNISEKISAVVRIDDTEPEVFYQILRFIYTNELETTDNDKVLKIWIFADKYEFNDLKHECENILTNSLTTENFKRIVTIADDRNAERLRTMCVFYFIDNIFLRKYNDVQVRKYHLGCISKLTSSHPHLLLEFLNRLGSDYNLVFLKPK